MPGYLVKWEIELEADCVEHAAELARQAMCDPDTLATIFTVEPEAGGTPVIVDVHDGDGVCIRA